MEKVHAGDTLGRSGGIGETNILFELVGTNGAKYELFMEQASNV